jgi:hypothetical protein
MRVRGSRQGEYEKEADLRGAVILAGVISLCGISALRAENGFGAQDQALAEPGAPGAHAVSGPAVPKLKAKLLTIAAGRPEAARLKLLGALLPDQPVRIVAAAR